MNHSFASKAVSKTSLRLFFSSVLALLLIGVTFASTLTIYAVTTTAASTNSATISASSSLSQPPSSKTIRSGFGESYNLEYPAGPRNLTQWPNLLQNTSASPTDYRDKFDWGTIRLGFTFQNLNTSNSKTNLTLTSSGSFNFTTLDNVISTLGSSGYNVILSDLDFSGFGSHTWVEDWLVLTEHYLGNPYVAAFELYNEPTSATWSSNVTTTSYNSTGSVASAYYNATLAVRQIDPSRTVIWSMVYMVNETCVNIYHSFCFALDPQFTLPNVVYDFHLYSPSSIPFNERYIANAIQFSKTYRVPIACTELNVEGGHGLVVTNFTTTEFVINELNQNKIPWIAWAYSLYPKYWIPVLNYNVSGVSTSSPMSSHTPARLPLFTLALTIAAYASLVFTGMVVLSPFILQRKGTGAQKLQRRNVRSQKSSTELS